MTKLKLGPIVEDKPVKVMLELPGPLELLRLAFRRSLRPSSPDHSFYILFLLCHIKR